MFLGKKFNKNDQITIVLKSYSKLIGEGWVPVSDDLKGDFLKNHDLQLAINSVIMNRLGKELICGYAFEGFALYEDELIPENICAKIKIPNVVLDLTPYIGTRIQIRTKSLDEMLATKNYVADAKGNLKAATYNKSNLPNYKTHVAEKVFDVAVDVNGLRVLDEPIKNYPMQHDAVSEILNTTHISYENLARSRRNYNCLLKTIDELIDEGWKVNYPNVSHKKYGISTNLGFDMASYFGQNVQCYFGRQPNEPMLIQGDFTCPVQFIKEVNLPKSVKKKKYCPEGIKFCSYRNGLELSFDKNDHMEIRYGGKRLRFEPEHCKNIVHAITTHSNCF